MTETEERWRVNIAANVPAEADDGGPGGWREIVMTVPARGQSEAFAVARRVCREAGAIEARQLSARPA